MHITHWVCKKSVPFLRTDSTGRLRVQCLVSSWNRNVVKPNLSLFGIPLHKICRTALTLGWINFMWWQPSECPEGLARSNWNAAFISLRELDILIHFVTWMVAKCWINWHLTVAQYALPSGLSHRLCWNKGAVRIVEFFSFCSDTAFATCHPIQCRANMRVADCATVWVCKCLRLI